MVPLNVHRTPSLICPWEQVVWVSSILISSYYFVLVWLCSTEIWLPTSCRGMATHGALEIFPISTLATQAKAYTKIYGNLSEYSLFLLNCEKMRGLRIAAIFNSLFYHQEVVSHHLPCSDNVWDFQSCAPQNRAIDYKTSKLQSRIGSSATL